MGTALELFRAEELGPCRATVTVERVTVASGRGRVVLSERWRPPAGPHETLSLLSHHPLVDAPAVLARARELADRWRRSSARSDELAPGGVLA